MSPYSAVKTMGDEEVERCAKFDIKTIHPSLVELVAAARGEFNERRVVRIAKTLTGVRDAWRASRVEDIDQATDAFVQLQCGKTIRLQVKSRRSGFGKTTSKNRARKFGCLVLRAPVTLSDGDVANRLRCILGIKK